MEQNEKQAVVRSCGDCAVKGCSGRSGKFPEFCLTKHMEPEVLEEILAKYSGENQRMMQAAAEVEAEKYGTITRIEEIMELARKMNYRKLGIATCVGLLAETRMITKILRYHGFEVFAVGCKCGMVPKTQVGISEECNSVGLYMCNPILQATLLNRENTDLNLVVGLCVGHDSLFYKHSEAFVTTLIAKDRVTGHNPAAAIYQAESYFSERMFPEKD